MSNPTTVERTRRVADRVLLATLTALTLAGCGDPDEGSESAKPSFSRTSQNPSPTPPTSPTPSPAVTAADGSNPKACTDGNCEIAVSEPVTIRFKVPDGPARLSLTKVGKNEVGYKVTSGSSTTTSMMSNTTSGEASGDGRGCIVVFSRGGSSSSCGLAGKPPGKKDGAVVLQVVAGADGTAILRLVSA